MRTNQGYSDDLYLSERSRFPGLQLVKLGCPGETTQTMMHGGICSYPQGSQLAAATAFLQAHRGSLAFLTIDIGANDVDSCATAGQISQACVSLGVASIRTDTPQIVQQLRSAGGPRLPMVGMNLYDPFLQSWLSGAAGQALARLSVTLATSLNQDLASIYHGAGMKTADVAATFATTNFTQVVSVAGHGDVPVNVGRSCVVRQGHRAARCRSR